MFQSSLVESFESSKIDDSTFVFTSRFNRRNLQHFRVLLNQLVRRFRHLALRCDGIFLTKQCHRNGTWFFHMGIVVVIEDWIFCQCLVCILNQTNSWCLVESSFDASISSRGFSFKTVGGIDISTTCTSIWSPVSLRLLHRFRDKFCCNSSIFNSPAAI